ncbi:hypothetical protein [Streptomyces sp. NPDC088400]
MISSGAPWAARFGLEDIGGLQTFEQVRSPAWFALRNHPHTAERAQP